MRFWRNVVHGISTFVDFMIVLFFIPILLYGAYAIWDSGQIYQQADASVFQTYKPTKDETLTFEELKKINPEVIGWLSVEGTNIDYPLVQGEYNSKYVNTNAEGQFSLAGSIFLDCRNSGDFSDVNNVIYGHHMQKNAMFGELENFVQQEFFDAHPGGELFHDGQWYPVEFFAFVPADAYDPILFDAELQGTEECQAYLDYVKEHAQNFRELSFETEESYLALSTCADTATNGRYLLIGRIANEPMQDKDRGED